MLFTQLDRYKELKEQVRKKVAIMTQQLEKLQWEQKADKERLAFEKRRQGEAQVLGLYTPDLQIFSVKFHQLFKLAFQHRSGFISDISD